MKNRIKCKAHEAYPEGNQYISKSICEVRQQIYPTIWGCKQCDNCSPGGSPSPQGNHVACGVECGLTEEENKEVK